MPRQKIRLNQAGSIIQPEKKTTYKIDNPKGIIYVRVSSEQQKREGHWLEYQEMNCRRRAEKNGIEIIGSYKDEWISGNSVQDRKDFMKAINFLQEQNKKGVKVHYFICDSTSRFSRNHNLKTTYDLVASVQQTGAELVAVWQWWIVDTSSESGMLQSGFSFLIDALESKRWQTRVRNGMKGRLLNGYRPFAQSPVWYEKAEMKNGDRKNKVLIISEPDATIVKEWLEMFADWKLISKQDLYSFFKERQLASNSKQNKSGKLHLSIIDRILDPRKLYVYAGYLTYPDWDITELIEAKHPALITLHTMEKILIRLGKYKNLTNMKTTQYNTNADDYPLRGVLLCPECDKNMTGRASKSGTGDLHYYYGCNNKRCPIYKKTLKRDLLHEELVQLIEDITPPKKVMDLTTAIFKDIWENKKNHQEQLNGSKKKRIKDIQEQMDNAMQKILTINNPTIAREIETLWEKLNEEKNQIEEEICYDPLGDTEMINLLNDAKTILLDPLTLRHSHDHNMKKLIIKVLFNGKIYYTKNQGYQTPDVSALYKLFGMLKNSHKVNGGP